MMMADVRASSSFPTARIGLVLAVACYVGIYNLAYRDLIAPVFAFWGLGYGPLAAEYFWTSVVLCIVPALWMPVQFTRPSLFLFYVQYFLIYIPGSFIVYQSTLPKLPVHEALILQLTMFAGLSIIQLTYLVRVPALRAFRVSSEMLCFAIGAGGLLMFGFLAITLRGNFQIASFTEVYDLRAAMVETLKSTGTRFGFYAQVWIEAFILPLVFAVAFWKRRWWVFLPVALGYIFLFGVGGAKAAILSVATLPMSYLLLSRAKGRIVFYLIAALSVMLLLGYASKALLPFKMHVQYIAVAHFRFLTVPPLTLPQYFEFFSSHAVTHLSHVTGLSWLLPYHFEQDIPYTVGSYFYKGAVGLNSGPWAGDGLAGFGLLGIPLISLLCAAVFRIVDATAAELDPRFAGLALSTVAALFGNDPLFTTMVTGGLGLMMITFLVAPPDRDGSFRMPREHRWRGSRVVSTDLS